MKKFYALALAVVAGLGIATAQQVQIQKQNLGADAKVLVSDVTLQKAAPSNMMKAPAKTPDLASIEGSYVTLAVDESDNEPMTKCTGATGIELYDESMELFVVSNLFADYFGQNIDDMAAFGEEITYASGETGYSLAIPGKGQTTLFTSKQGDVTLYMGAHSPSGAISGGYYYTIYSNDIELIAAEPGFLHFPYYIVDDDEPEDLEFGIACVYSTDEGSYIYSFFAGLEMIEANGVMDTYEYMGAEDNSMPHVEYPILGIYDEGAITVWNMGGLNRPCKFVIDGDKATATNQIINSFETQDYGKLDFYACKAGEKENFVLDATYAVVDGKTVITIVPEEWWAYSTEGWAGYYADTTLKFDCDLSGIEAVAVENTNAEGPAVYFNLQGIQVANPVAGQMYIVKQGNQVSKIIR